MTIVRPPAVDLPLADELTALSARMSALLLSEESVDSALAGLGSLAQETAPGATGAGVTIVGRAQRRSSGATSELVREADDLQYQLDDGPCLTAAAAGTLVRIDDLGQDRRWPRWSAAALRLGLRAAMSAPVVAGTESLGAIKVHSDLPCAFTRHSERVLTLFSTQAALLVADVRSQDRADRLSAGLRQAVDGRDTITLATGVLMGRHGVDEGTAATMLRARCTHGGTTVLEAARAVLDSVVRRGR
jgi:GAF domain-containing protein